MGGMENKDVHKNSNEGDLELEIKINKIYSDFKNGAQWYTEDPIPTGFVNPYDRDNVIKILNTTDFNIELFSQETQKQLWELMLNVDTSYDYDVDMAYPPEILKDFIEKNLDFGKLEHIGYGMYILTRFEKKLASAAEWEDFESQYVKGVSLDPIEKWKNNFTELLTNKLKDNSNLIISEYLAGLSNHEHVLKRNFSDIQKNKLNKIRSIKNEDFPKYSKEEFHLYSSILISLYEHNYLKNVVQDTLAITIDQLNIKEQFATISFLMQLKKFNQEEVKSFADTYKNNGLKTFLSLAHGGSEMGQKILELGEQLPADVAEKIFEKYATIVDSVDSIAETIQNGFKKNIHIKQGDIQKIEQSLYLRGVKLLEEFHSQINENTEPDSILDELERIKSDTLVTLSVFKYALRSGNELPLEDIEGSEFSKRNGMEVAPDEITEMVDMYQQNWKHFENQEIIQPVIKKFKESLTGDSAKNQEIYTFKKDGQINAFVKFTETMPGIKYASALNVDTSIHGYGLGEAMMQEALHREAQENILYGMCESEKEFVMSYFEKGFIATGFSPDHPPFLDIWWNESDNLHIQSKQMHKDELVLAYLGNKIPDSMEIRKAKNLTELHGKEFPQGKCLTRCFRDPAGSGDWYAVYEPIPTTYQTPKNTHD